LEIPAWFAWERRRLAGIAALIFSGR